MFEVDDRDGVRLLVMRHGKVNAMDMAFCRQFVAELRALDTPDTRALVITAEGATFSAGVDLLRLLEGGEPYLREFLPVINHFFGAVFSFPKPVVAAINGHAIAGGCVLACACDRRIMADGGFRTGVPELLVGVPFPAEAFEIMRAAVPPQWFNEIITSGRLHQPEAALERGLIDEVVEPTRLMEHAIDTARNMASVGDELFRLTKTQIRQPALQNMAIGREHVRAIEDMWAAPEAFERIRRYVEKTFKPTR